MDEDYITHVPSPVLVHCANGLGKTGVVIATHFALKAFTAEETLDLAQIVKKLRRQRGQMIQTHEQYRFCCSGIADALDPIPEKDEDAAREKDDTLKEMTKLSALPHHMEPKERPFSAPIDSDSLTPRTQRKLMLQNMLPPPPPSSSRKDGIGGLRITTPPPPFSSPKDVSTPPKETAPTSESSVDSFTKPKLSHTSDLNVKVSKSSSSSLDSLPTKDETVQPKKSVGDEETPRTSIDDKMPNKLEEESVTILEVDFSHATLEEPGVDQDETTKDPESVKKLEPKGVPKKKGTALFSGSLSTTSKTATKPKAVKKEPPVTKPLEKKEPPVTKPVEKKEPPVTKSVEQKKLTKDSEAEKSAISPPKDDDVPDKKTDEKAAVEDVPKGSTLEGDKGTIDEKEDVEKDRPPSPPSHSTEKTATDETPDGFEIGAEEPVGFNIGDGEPSPEPVKKVPEKKPERKGWKPPPKVDVPKEVKPVEVKLREPPKIDIPRDHTQTEEWKPKQVGRLSVSRFQVFNQPIAPHKPGQTKQTSPPKKEPVVSQQKTEPLSLVKEETQVLQSTNELLPGVVQEKSVTKSTDPPKTEEKTVGKLNTSKWLPSSPPSADDSNKPAWMQLIQQRKQERTAKPDQVKPVGTAVKSVGNIDLSKFEGGAKSEPLKPWQQQKQSTSVVKPEQEQQKEAPMATKTEDKTSESVDGSTPHRVGKLDLSKFAAFGAAK